MDKKMNLFCIVGKTKSGKETYLSRLLEDKEFIFNNSLKRFNYGTTQKEHHHVQQTQEYYLVNIDDIPRIIEEGIVEMRSYYTLTEGEVKYFTKEEDLERFGNYICICSPYQYESYKNWMALKNIEAGYKKYNLYMIYIDCEVLDRIRRMQNILNENTLVEICRRIIQDKNDFENVTPSLEELSNPLQCDNVCYVRNTYAPDNIYDNIKNIQTFIKSKTSK